MNFKFPALQIDLLLKKEQTVQALSWFYQNCFVSFYESVVLSNRRPGTSWIYLQFYTLCVFPSDTEPSHPIGRCLPPTRRRSCPHSNSCRILIINQRGWCLCALLSAGVRVHNAKREAGRAERILKDLDGSGELTPPSGPALMLEEKLDHCWCH